MGLDQDVSLEKKKCHAVMGENTVKGSLDNWYS